jgi:hypothetical protein
MKFGDDEWQEMTAQFERSFKDLETQQEEYWASLNKEQQLDLFCCIVRRLVKGEIEDGRSYRGILYDTFGWGPEAYAVAQMAGYINLHNAIFKKERIHEILVGVLKDVEIDIDPEVLNQVLGKHGVWV